MSKSYISKETGEEFEVLQQEAIALWPLDFRATVEDLETCDFAKVYKHLEGRIAESRKKGVVPSELTCLEPEALGAL